MRLIEILKLAEEGGIHVLFLPRRIKWIIQVLDFHSLLLFDTQFLHDFLDILVKLLLGLVNLFHFVVFGQDLVLNPFDFICDVFHALDLGLLFVHHVVV